MAGPSSQPTISVRRVTPKVRLLAWGVAASAAVSGLSSCSYAEQYAATINDAGHVQVDMCFTSADLVIESSSGDGVLELSLRTDASDEDAGRVDLEAPSGWTATGTIELLPDSVLTVWDTYDYRRVNEPTTSTSQGATTSSRFEYVSKPALVVEVSELKHGAYFHDGHNISTAAWRDVCDPDDGLFGPLVGIVLAFICFLVIAVVFVICLVKVLRKPRAARH